MARSRVNLPPVRPASGVQKKKRPMSSNHEQQKMDEFINQKKEMFRVQLAYNTLEKEITDLNSQAVRRHEALETSKKELDNDRRGVMNFVNNNNAQRQAKENLEKEEIRKKAEKEDQLRKHENTI